MPNEGDTEAGTPNAARDLDPTRTFCACGHSEFVHTQTEDRPCLYSVCVCTRFSQMWAGATARLDPTPFMMPR